MAVSRVVAMTVSSERPEYLGPTLESWSRVRGVRDWPFLFVLEPGSQAAECVRLIHSVFADCRFEVLVNERRLGVLGNPHHAFECGFERADFVVMSEEDVEVADDILEYLEFGSRRFEADPEVLAVCASGLNHFKGVNPSLWIRYCHFSPLVWGTWRHRWENILRDTWDLDYTSGPTREESGWDWNIGRILKERRMHCVFPDVSRSLHIGKYGAHVYPDVFEASQISSYVPEHPAGYWLQP